MIPADVASSLRNNLPNASSAPVGQQAQPVPAAQRIADVLSNLVPGQRVFADIQAMLPNGTYRAVVAQRDVTLALPFSAKAGDSLELEVVESEGKLTLAVVANRGERQEGRAGAQQASVATSLSNAGKMIGDLMQEIDGQGKRAPPAQLNGNQALVATMPKDAAQLAPVLKQALTQSGIFYEAHQARWVRGQMPIEQLRQEPQGRIPVPARGLPSFPAGEAAAQPRAGQPASAGQAAMSFLFEAGRFSPTASPGGVALQQFPQATTALPQAANNNPTPAQASTAANLQLPPGSNNLTQPQQPAPGMLAASQFETLSPETPGNNPATAQGNNATPAQQSLQTTSNPAQLQQARQAEQEPGAIPVHQAPRGEATAQQQSPAGIPRDLAPLVQQQLDGLANQNFAWQGQVWPGQQMWWEIGENPEDRNVVGDEANARWRTQLKLTLPSLGGVDARLYLQANGALGIRIFTDSSAGQSRLRDGAPALQQQLEAAGLSIRQILVDHVLAES